MNIRDPGNQNQSYPTYAAGNAVSRLTRSSKTEGHPNEIAHSLRTSDEILKCFTKHEISLATSHCASRCRVDDVEQRGLSIM
jgi:hypothetical protein